VRPSTAKAKQPASYKQFIANQNPKSTRSNRNQRVQSATQRSNHRDPKPRKHSSKKRDGSKKSRSTQQMMAFQPVQPQQLNTISHLERLQQEDMRLQ
jgi:hypothetical protein